MQVYLTQGPVATSTTLCKLQPLDPKSQSEPRRGSSAVPWDAEQAMCRLSSCSACSFTPPHAAAGRKRGSPPFLFSFLQDPSLSTGALAHSSAVEEEKRSPRRGPCRWGGSGNAVQYSGGPLEVCVRLLSHVHCAAPRRAG